MAELSGYERQALRDIDAFKHPSRSRLETWWRRLSTPLDQAATAAFESGAGAAAVRLVEDLVEIINDGATWSVRPRAVLEAFARHGHRPAELGDLRQLALADIDGAVGSLRLKYQGLAVAEGAGSGLLGGLAIAADVALVVGLALRAANEYATYYGFDVASAGERLFAVRILAAAASPTTEERTAALGELSKLGLELRQSDGWRPPTPNAGRHVTRKIAEAIAVRLLKAKLGQLVPFAGAVVASSYNAWLVGMVTDTAYHLYRERFLVERHGEAVLSYLDG